MPKFAETPSECKDRKPWFRSRTALWPSVSERACPTSTSSGSTGSTSATATDGDHQRNADTVSPVCQGLFRVLGGIKKVGDLFGDLLTKICGCGCLTLAIFIWLWGKKRLNKTAIKKKKNPKALCCDIWSLKQKQQYLSFCIQFLGNTGGKTNTRDLLAKDKEINLIRFFNDWRANMWQRLHNWVHFRSYSW